MIIVYGGLADEPDHAFIAGRRIKRRPGEPLREFIDRAKPQAEDDVAFVGGLPDDEEPPPFSTAMPLPAPDELTEDDRASIISIIQQADGLAAAIMAVEVPSIDDYRALNGLMAFAQGSGLFALSERHLAALRRLPPVADLQAWRDQEATLAALR